MIEPELNGKPTELTKKSSKTLNILRILGAKSLKINSKIATETTLAIMKFLVVTFFCFLKKYNIPIQGNANKAIK